MRLDYNSETMQRWRKEVQDFLGFELRIPEYTCVRYCSDEYMAPVWDYYYWFYDSQDKPICRLQHNNDFFSYDTSTCIPGVPDTFGSDEDWNQIWEHDHTPVFKGFPWAFSLEFFDEQERPVKEITARRSFANDRRPTIHMAWYLAQWTYDASGKSNCTRTFQSFTWEIP